MAEGKPSMDDALQPAGSGEDSAGEKKQHLDNSNRADVQKGEQLNVPDMDNLPPADDVEFVMDKVNTLTVDECNDIIDKLLKYHEYDYNFSQSLRDKLAALRKGPADDQTVEDWELQLKTEVAVCKFYSPYPEVRAVSTPTDDPDMPCETIRAHLLGYAWAVLAQFVNSLFNSRFPTITITSQVAQILLYPCGLLLAWVLPDWGFTVRGNRISLNPGPWSYKEQVLSTLIVNVGLTSAYCFWNIQTQTIYYHDQWLTPAYSILLLLSTQMMGLGFSGLLRRFVVYPVEAIWPSILPTLALNRALLVPDKKEKIHGWSISRYKFFFIVFGIMFVYFWLPDFLFPALSYFTWMCWIAPDNFNLNIITGSNTGLGFNPISSFDWNVFGTVFFPLTYPFFAFMQQLGGQVLGGLIIIGLYWSNAKSSAYLPINSSGIFDNTGQEYNITRVLREGTSIVDEDSYKEYSPPFYAAGNLLVYGAFFAFYPLTMVFITLDCWRPIYNAYKSMMGAIAATVRSFVSGLKNAVSSLAKGKVGDAARHASTMMSGKGSIYDSFDDPFTHMMKAYPEVPDWWFLAIVLISFIFAISILANWTQLDTPVWTIFFVIGLNLVFLIPMSYLYAVSGTTEGLNVVTELIIGYALPGRPEALMFVKAFGYNINGQADNYIADQKMGFYAKVPPRAMYRGQVMSAVITSFVAYGVVQFADNEIEGICTPDQPAKFNCANGSLVYYSASVVWVSSPPVMHTPAPLLLPPTLHVLTTRRTGRHRSPAHLLADLPCHAVVLPPGIPPGPPVVDGQALRLQSARRGALGAPRVGIRRARPRPLQAHQLAQARAPVAGHQRHDLLGALQPDLHAPRHLPGRRVHVVPPEVQDGVVGEVQLRARGGACGRRRLLGPHHLLRRAVPPQVGRLVGHRRLRGHD